MRKIQFGLLVGLISLSLLIPFHAFGSKNDHSAEKKVTKAKMGEKMHGTEEKDTHAEEDEEKHGSEGGEISLENQVKLLTKRLERLEKLALTFTGFMPEISERFHVLHRAGDAEDWGLASHEIMELKRLVGVSKIIDPEKGQLMESFMAGQLEVLEKSVEHGSKKAFKAALIQTVSNCNACHKAAGSPFIQVSLDIPDNMSFRHPHLLAKSKVPTMKHGH